MVVWHLSTPRPRGRGHRQEGDGHEGGRCGREHFERIDRLVNNAGIYLPKPFTEYTPEDFERMIGTNVAGYFFVTQQAVAQMRKQRSGSRRRHLDDADRSAVGRRAHLAARHHEVHDSGIQPRPGGSTWPTGSGPTRSNRAEGTSWLGSRRGSPPAHAIAKGAMYVSVSGLLRVIVRGRAQARNATPRCSKTSRSSSGS